MSPLFSQPKLFVNVFGSFEANISEEEMLRMLAASDVALDSLPAAVEQAELNVEPASKARLELLAAVEEEDEA